MVRGRRVAQNACRVLCACRVARNGVQNEAVVRSHVRVPARELHERLCAVGREPVRSYEVRARIAVQQVQYAALRAVTWLLGG